MHILIHPSIHLSTRTTHPAPYRTFSTASAATVRVRACAARERKRAALPPSTPAMGPLKR